jgi:hypothetical protein
MVVLAILAIFQNGRAGHQRSELQVGFGTSRIRAQVALVG